MPDQAADEKFSLQLQFRPYCFKMQDYFSHPHIQPEKKFFKCIHLYNIRNCFSVLYFLRPLHITEKENFTEIFH